MSANFDLDYHIRRVAAPGAGTFEDVLEMARLAEMQDFDRARALWEMTLVDGLENDGAAMICKFHHALTDGIGGIQIAMSLFNLSEELYEHDPAARASLQAIVAWGLPQRLALRHRSAR